jgi:Leucine-rich repeat (LRR) protein
MDYCACGWEVVLANDSFPPRLAISRNLIQTVPVEMSMCSRLRYLNLRRNQLTEFPACVSGQQTPCCGWMYKLTRTPSS